MAKRGEAPPATDGLEDTGASSATVLEPGDDLLGLEALDDESFGDTTCYFYRLPMPGEAEGPSHGYCHKTHGAVNPQAVADAIGGGKYRVLVKRNGKITDRVLCRIAGAPRVPPPMPALAGSAAPSGTAAPTVDGTAELRAELRELRAELARKPAGGLVAELGPVIQLLVPLLRPAEAISPVTTFNAMASAFEKGFERGRTGDSEEGGVAGIIRETVNGIVAIGNARGPLGAAVPAAAPGADPAAGAPRAAAPGPDALTVLVLRAFANHAPAPDTADAAELVLGESELAQLRATPHAAVMMHLQRHAGALDAAETERLRAFVGELMTEICAPRTAET